MYHICRPQCQTQIGRAEEFVGGDFGAAEMDNGAARLIDLAHAVRCGIVSFAVEGVEGAEVQRRLRADGINVSVSPRRYTRIDMEDRGLTEVIRASAHYYNTEAEIDRLVERLALMG